MAVLDKDRPRGLRVPSLSALKGFNSKNKSSESPSPKNTIPSLQIPAPSAFSPRSDLIPVRPPRPQEKELPPNPLPPQPPAVGGSPPPPPISKESPEPVVNQPQPQSRFQSQPQSQPQPQSQFRPQPQPQIIRKSPPQRQDSLPAPAYTQTYAPDPTPSPAPASAPVSRPAPTPKPVPRQPIPRVASPPSVSPVPVHQRTPPSSEGEPEQRLSNGTEDSLDAFIPEPEPEPELDRGSSGPNGAGSSEEDDRPWTPPEVEPVVVPLNKLHYNCYQEHRAMHKANNTWYALPCMTCHKFDREIRRRCVFCCLRVCVDCFSKLQRCPNRSLTQLMEDLSKEGPSEAKSATKTLADAPLTIAPSTE